MVLPQTETIPISTMQSLKSYMVEYCYWFRFESQLSLGEIVVLILEPYSIVLVSGNTIRVFISTIANGPSKVVNMFTVVQRDTTRGRGGSAAEYYFRRCFIMLIFINNGKKLNLLKIKCMTKYGGGGGVGVGGLDNFGQP